jgi:integrase
LRSKKYAKGTLKKWQHSKIHFADYVHSKAHKMLDVRDIDVVQVRAYYDFLRHVISERSKANLSIGHSKRHIQILRTFLDWCVDNKYLKINPINNWLPTEKPRRNVPIHIPYEDTMKMYYAENLTVAERCGVDIYTFLTFTSLDYGDYQKVHHVEIKMMELEGKELEYFDWTRNKGRIDAEPSECTIVLLPIAKELLNKYKGGFPKFSNSGLNKIIKRVAGRLEIPNAKRLTTKTARKSFAMMLLNEGGLRYEILKEVVGHESVTTTERYYARIKTDTILRETAHLPQLFTNLSNQFKSDALQQNLFIRLEKGLRVGVASD